MDGQGEGTSGNGAGETQEVQVVEQELINQALAFGDDYGAMALWAKELSQADRDQLVMELGQNIEVWRDGVMTMLMDLIDNYLSGLSEVVRVLKQFYTEVEWEALGEVGELAEDGDIS